MRIRETLRVFGGSIVVYAAIAACGASDNGSAPGAIRDGGGPSAVDGAPGSSGGGLLDALADAVADVLDPVPDATAGPLPPLVATEPCNKTITYGTGTVTNANAIHSFPGKTINDLAALQVVTHLAAGTPLRVTVGADVYEHLSAPTEIHLRDGSAVVACNNAGHTVTFILPQ